MSPLFLIAIGAAIALGVWHLALALQAIFVFQTDEPVISWIAILTGPASTLPAALVAVFAERAGGCWLVVAGVLSFLVFAVGERGAMENLFPFLSRISIPMILIGAVVIYLPRRRSSSSA